MTEHGHSPPRPPDPAQARPTGLPAPPPPAERFGGRTLPPWLVASAVLSTFGRVTPLILSSFAVLYAWASVGPGVPEWERIDVGSAGLLTAVFVAALVSLIAQGWSAVTRRAGALAISGGAIGVLDVAAIAFLAIGSASSPDGWLNAVVVGLIVQVVVVIGAIRSRHLSAERSSETSAP